MKRFGAILMAGAVSAGILTAPAPAMASSGPDISLAGHVVAGFMSGCMLLEPDVLGTGTAEEYLLLGGDRSILVPGAHVLVTGKVAPDAISICMQGMPLEVASAQPI